MEALVCSWLCF